MRIYIAGPYSKPDPATNTALAIRVAERVWAAGDVPYVPHLTMFWHFYREHSYGEWLEYDLVWLKQCEALLRIPGESNGADAEVEWARHWKMSVFEGLTGYFAWKGIVPAPREE